MPLYVGKDGGRFGSSHVLTDSRSIERGLAKSILSRFVRRDSGVLKRWIFGFGVEYQ